MPLVRRVLLIVRCLRLGLHLLWAALTVAIAYPFIRDARRLWLKQRWSRQLLEILGVRIDAQLSSVTPGSLFVVNHISWLDIYALNAARPLAFVSKAEVRSWPLIGWLAAHADTLFLSRESRRQTKRVNVEMGELLLAEKDVAIFPEGTTTEGTQLLHFHGALLQSAVDIGRPVQPVALSYYGGDGRRSAVPAYVGETTLSESLLAILTGGPLTVRLRPTPPLDPRVMTRRELAYAARGAIAFSLGLASANEVAEPAHNPAGEQTNADNDSVEEITKPAIAG